LNVTLDTGSDWLIVQSSGCSSCTGETWDQAASSTYATDSTTMTLSYGSASVSGLDATDDFYLDADMTFGALDFEFMLITKQKGISPSGGIMGFSRDYDFGTEAAGPLFYYGLYNSSMITAKIFATYYADVDT
jgi:hypothetical protein